MDAVGIVKEIGCIEFIVAHEIKDTSVEAVGARARHRVNHSSGGEAVLCRIVARQHRELLNRIHTQVRAEHASRSCIGVVVHKSAVETIAVLRRPVPADRQLHSQAARPLRTLEKLGRLLTSDRRHAGLKRGQSRPVAAVQGQFTHCV